MKMADSYILPTAYFGPVQYYCRMVSGRDIYIEQYDHYSRQTYRNRCVIMGANGIINLSIPVKRPHGNKTLVKDILVDYDTDWQKDHYGGILSAYTSSPFFEFYFDDYRWIFSQKTKYLIDLNTEINTIILSQLGVCKDIKITDNFVFMDKEEDLRNIISPKTKLIKDIHFKAAKYTQVFSGRFGFIPNLSIMDLLFNTGTEAPGILKQSFIEKE